jgi:hypothetical protein
MTRGLYNSSMGGSAMQKTLAWSLGALALFVVSPSAQAQDQRGPGGSPRGVITLAEVTITGRIQKPIAAVDVSRIAPKLTLAELRQPFLDRIEQAIYKDPF